jgi:DNA topoisomerase-1
LNLLIVESPAKAKTIEKYLGADYKVVASFGHVRDLPEKEIGVDTDKNFEPKYVVPLKAKKTVSMLKKYVANAKSVFMATDYDREGEAIAWHISEVFKLKNPKRITFHEITKEALVAAVNKPREIDMDLVDAQQARRILDRLVGYKLSPFLWKKVYKGLSAGRVQSVAVRLVVEREREIQNFKSIEYWTVKVDLEKDAKKFSASLVEIDGKKIDKLEIKNEKMALEVLKNLENADYKIKNITERAENRWPLPPFTTSTMQQEASKRFGFTAKKTMKLAQDLYENGLITYMRTDSVSLSSQAIDAARKYIVNEFGQNYLPAAARLFKTKTKGAQEAHEAIRPTNVANNVTKIKDPEFNDDHMKLYDLIWKRMMACQMKEAILDTVTAEISAKNYGFRASGTKIKFDGFTKVWALKIEEKSLPNLIIGDICKIIEIFKEQHFTEPPARFNEASLIKTLEENGIGRPSTYAPIISTIIDRKYVILDQRNFKPTEVGFIVTDLLVANFPDVVDIGFTSQVEQDFDEIAEGKKNWVVVLKEFYDPFEKNLEKKYTSVEKVKITDEKTDKVCPKCGKPLVVKLGRFGRFYACSGFPECKHTEQIIHNVGMKCPECKEGDVIERQTKRGKTFWGCSKFPKCKWGSWNDPTKQKVEPSTD